MCLKYGQFQPKHAYKARAYNKKRVYRMRNGKTAPVTQIITGLDSSFCLPRPTSFVGSTGDVFSSSSPSVLGEPASSFAHTTGRQAIRPQTAPPGNGRRPETRADLDSQRCGSCCCCCCCSAVEKVLVLSEVSMFLSL